MIPVTAIATRLSEWWKSHDDDLGDVWPFLLVANVLYLFLLGVAPLWYDEANSYWFAQMPFARMIAATAGDTHPPLYYLLLSFVVRVFGPSHFMLRFPSVMFGLLTIYIVRQIARELNLSRAATLIALGLVTLSPFQLHFAQEARMYTLLQALVLGATLAALRKQLMRFVLLSALSLWTHNYGLFYLVVNCGVLAWAVWKTQLRWPVFETVVITGLLGGAALVLWLPWAFVLLGQMRTVAGGYWIMPVTPGALVFTLTNLLYAFTLPPWLAPGAIMIGVGLLTWLTIRVIEKRDEAALLLAWLVAAPVVLAVVVSILWRPILLYRGLAPSLPALMLLVGWGAAQLPRAHRLYAAILIVPLFVASIVGQYLWTPNQKGLQDHQVLDQLLAQWREGDIIIYSNEGYLVEWHSRAAHLPQVVLPRTCPQNNLGGLSEQTFHAFGIADPDPETIPWRRAWFVSTIFPTITQCEVDMSRAFLARHLHWLAFAIEGNEFIEANIWIVER